MRTAFCWFVSCLRAFLRVPVSVYPPPWFCAHEQMLHDEEEAAEEALVARSGVVSGQRKETELAIEEEKERAHLAV